MCELFLTIGEINRQQMEMEIYRVNQENEKEQEAE
jgi:hypothetical protein